VGQGGAGALLGAEVQSARALGGAGEGGERGGEGPPGWSDRTVTLGCARCGVRDADRQRSDTARGRYSETTPLARSTPELLSFRILSLSACAPDNLSAPRPKRQIGATSEVPPGIVSHPMKRAPSIEQHSRAYQYRPYSDCCDHSPDCECSYISFSLCLGVMSSSFMMHFAPVQA
jgi:hypothetical protein